MLQNLEHKMFDRILNYLDYVINLLIQKRCLHFSRWSSPNGKNESAEKKKI